MGTVDKEHWQQRLIELIAHLKVTQADFAMETGIDPTYASRMLYEPGKVARKNVGPEPMAKIMATYGLSAGWFDKKLGAEMPTLSASGEMNQSVREEASRPALATVNQVKWPFQLVSYRRLMTLKKTLGAKVAAQALTDMDKQLEGVVMKWERELIQGKSRRQGR